MNTRDRLKNKLVSKIQRLSIDKLMEVDKILSKIESQAKSKEEIFKMAGRWKNMNPDFFSHFTTKLHSNRAIDRQID